MSILAFVIAMVFFIHELEEIFFLHKWASSQAVQGDKYKKSPIIKLLSTNNYKTIFNVINFEIFVIFTLITVAEIKSNNLIIYGLCIALMIHAISHVISSIKMSDIVPGTISMVLGTVWMVIVLYVLNIFPVLFSIEAVSIGILINIVAMILLFVVFSINAHKDIQ